jgi:hypothetical protein
MVSDFASQIRKQTHRDQMTCQKSELWLEPDPPDFVTILPLCLSKQKQIQFNKF